ncbi:bifunctional transcriptional activator/DNA repair protein Ada [Paracoccus aestuarii]|uniref:methylated-DNA--[protein]-cysteine S-methyltransferase n=2 Tax=Paracoccus aestuarii TaxID=453842 RepID=A0A418ZY00_9RHOB|nr:bifunctional transcriptional activator/DNA repair protein Ada [Paracoccus aestuarii]RJL05402.1 bifunctional transcriptional activator/DNA repair protein Ada [Paracoccus aestuarii]WCQ99754.1 bifunctional transcriptional activator/DNA repair protein Ada [Paracoccus aestuarii]
MMRDLTDHDRLYAALLARDASFDGVALVGVTSTGIFCRLTCPARKPLAAHCRWFADATGARAAGFRPCLRCRPEGQPPALVAGLLAALDAGDLDWSEERLARAGHDPSTVRRLFRAHLGRSFLRMARDRRLRRGGTAITKGDRMIDAQLEAGFDSASGFRAAFRRLFGHAPLHMAGQADLRADWLDTPLGGMIAIADDRALHLLEFTGRKALARGLAWISAQEGGRIGLGRSAVTDLVEARLQDYFAGRCGRLHVPLRLRGTDFQTAVWQALRAIPAGQTRSYGQIAAAIGRPTAVRAVAAANGANRLALVVPCHRVIGADGTMTGYAGGLQRKERLIALERAYAGKG